VYILLKNIISPRLISDALSLYDEHYRVGHINKQVFEYKMDGSKLPFHFEEFFHHTVVQEARTKWDFKRYKFTNVKIRKYPTGTFYERHIDFHQTEPNKIYLSFSITLNTHFEGGEFGLEDDGRPRQIFNIKKGDGILFDATNYHEVLPITYGERMSLIGHFIADRN